MAPKAKPKAAKKDGSSIGRVTAALAAAAKEQTKSIARIRKQRKANLQRVRRLRERLKNLQLADLMEMVMMKATMMVAHPEYGQPEAGDWQPAHPREAFLKLEELVFKPALAEHFQNMPCAEDWKSAYDDYCNRLLAE